MPVHVAEAARIHENVEAELLPRAESAQHLIVPAAMPQPQVDNLPPPSFARHLHRLPNLAIRMMAMLVEERSRNLHFERLFIEQVHNRL